MAVFRIMGGIEKAVLKEFVGLMVRRDKFATDDFTNCKVKVINTIRIKIDPKTKDTILYVNRKKIGSYPLGQTGTDRVSMDYVLSGQSVLPAELLHSSLLERDDVTLSRQGGSFWNLSTN